VYLVNLANAEEKELTGLVEEWCVTLQVEM
jgi:hypothetical protein